MAATIQLPTAALDLSSECEGQGYCLQGGPSRIDRLIPRSSRPGPHTWISGAPWVILRAKWWEREYLRYAPRACVRARATEVRLCLFASLLLLLLLLVRIGLSITRPLSCE